MVHYKTFPISLLAVLFFTFAAASSAQVTSTYTSLAAKNCRPIKVNGDENVLSHLRCKGIAGFKLDVLAGEEHEYVELITPNGKSFDVSINPASYSSVGNSAEWRTRGSDPVALIIRLNLRGADANKVTSSILVVSKVTRTSACVVDTVDSSSDQNVKARNLADNSASRKCRPST